MEWIGTGHPNFIGYFWPIWTLYFKMSCSPGHRILKKAVLSSKIKCSLANMTLFLCLCSLLVFVLNQMWDELTHPLFASYYLKKIKNWPTDPPPFCHERANKHFFFGLTSTPILYGYTPSPSDLILKRCVVKSNQRPFQTLFSLLFQCLFSSFITF